MTNVAFVRVVNGVYKRQGWHEAVVVAYGIADALRELLPNFDKSAFLAATNIPKRPTNAR